MGEHTVTYSEGVKGFPSFYSYIPDMMVGMNNYFYTFKQGNIYRHNTNSIRNNYYGVQYSSTIKSVFNQSPLENKLFKTLNLESDSAWSAVLQTDLQLNGNIDADWFVKKESDWFAFVRAQNTTANPIPSDQYALRNLNGLGASINVQVGVPGVGQTTITFALTTDIGSIISIGDYFYFGTPSGVPPNVIYTPSFCGIVETVNIDIASGINTIVITTAAPAVAIPGVATYFLYVKSAIAESHGMLGHYCEFTLTNTLDTPTELFAVESEVMKSYP